MGGVFGGLLAGSVARRPISICSRWAQGLAGNGGEVPNSLWVAQFSDCLADSGSIGPSYRVMSLWAAVILGVAGGIGIDLILHHIHLELTEESTEAAPTQE